MLNGRAAFNMALMLSSGIFKVLCLLYFYHGKTMNYGSFFPAAGPILCSPENEDWR